jgi:hypothetical protein
MSVSGRWQAFYVYSVTSTEPVLDLRSHAGAIAGASGVAAHNEDARAQDHVPALVHALNEHGLGPGHSRARLHPTAPHQLP